MSSDILIRSAVPGDVGAIRDIFNEAIATTTASFHTEPRTEREQAAWLANRDPRHPVLVAEVDDRVVGWASISPWSPRAAYRDTAETSVYVGSKHRGQGIGRQLKLALIDHARAAGMHTLIAQVAEGSDASLHLNLALGFQHVGTLTQVGHKFGRHLDVHVLQLMLDE